MSNQKSIIKWQNGDTLYEGHYIVTVLRPSTGDIFVSNDYYDFCDEWQNYGEGTPYKVIAFYPMAEIEPYIDSKFKLGQFVVENGIIGTVTKIYDDLKLLVIGRNLRPLIFNAEMTRLATNDEALEISDHYRELGYYYNIDKNDFLKY